MDRTWRSAGKVYLVGAGPGDPRFLTVMGADLIRAADVVVFDALVDRRTLELAREDALLLRAGKRAGAPSADQGDINEMLVAHARRGRLVVRLKGGDPFVFGRGAEEAEALERAGIEWEVVPGVSSGIAVPSRVGIPLTHRDLASTVFFATAEESRDKSRPAIEWDAVARTADTVVVFMCSRSIVRIAGSLIDGGRDPGTPVAVVSRGTWTDETVYTSTLGSLAREDFEHHFEAPALAVVGEVAAFPERLRLLRDLTQEMTHDEIVA